MKRVAEAIRRAADQALSNIMIEGLLPEEEFRQLRERHIKGEITSEQFRAFVIGQAQEADRQAMVRNQATEARRRAANQALANAMIAGFEPDEAFMTDWNRHVSGEITREEFRAILFERAEARKNC
jgi:uncharacterized membrane protein